MELAIAIAVIGTIASLIGLKLIMKPKNKIGHNH